MLSRIPFWGWLLVILVALYLVYNPLGFSLWHMWTMGDVTSALPLKILASLVVFAVLALVLHGCITSMSAAGLALLLSLVVAGLWSVHSLVQFDPSSLHFWAWTAQPLAALVLTVGWQWPKIWRRSTGSVTVSDADTPA